jgi:hypothetical protein
MTPVTELFEPETLTEYLEYLDGLRESGVTNMYGAAPYLAEAFGMKPTTARAVLSYWMQTFSERHKEEAS